MLVLGKVTQRHSCNPFEHGDNIILPPHNPQSKLRRMYKLVQKTQISVVSDSAITKPQPFSLTHLITPSPFYCSLCFRIAVVRLFILASSDGASRFIVNTKT
eukprot:m.171755 g.171755  ORF g.171755 m.171755 type:complete len:102 (+) comp14561_c1_seq1:975-1280(+)